jgi:hypothetical protein
MNHTGLFQQFQRLAGYSVRTTAHLVKKAGIIRLSKRGWRWQRGSLDKPVVPVMDTRFAVAV